MRGVGGGIAGREIPRRLRRRVACVTEASLVGGDVCLAPCLSSSLWARNSRTWEYSSSSVVACFGFLIPGVVETTCSIRAQRDLFYSAQKHRSFLHVYLQNTKYELHNPCSIALQRPIAREGGNSVGGRPNYYGWLIKQRCRQYHANLRYILFVQEHTKHSRWCGKSYYL